VREGSCDFRDGCFVVDVPPHASRRFRELFKEVKGGTRPPWRIENKPDTAIDLEWFFQRYPASISESAQIRMRTGSEQWRKGREVIDQIMTRDFKAPETVSFKEGRQPYSFQARAAALARQTGRILLLDDGGLGKTVSALAMISDPAFLPAIVVPPPHIAEQWVEEYIEVFTTLRPHIVKGTTPYKLPPADVYVMPYSRLSGWVSYSHEFGHRSIILDEIQDLRRGAETDKGRAARHFVEAPSVRLRAGLTATPIYNYGSEIYQIVNYIAPGALGSWQSFIIEWCVSKGNHWVVKEPDVLGDWLRSEGIALRRTEHDEEVKSNLPALNRLIVNVPWDDRAVDDDQALRRALALKVMSGNFTQSGQAARELDVMMRHDTGLAKARGVAAYVSMLLEAGEKVLLTGWHRDVYDIWLRELERFKPVMYTGTESPSQKRRSKQEFINGDAGVMIMSLRSGSGTDGLQDVCAHVVFGELDWSPQVHTQVIWRLRRPGQKRQVTAHFLVTDGGSDPVIVETNGLKASQSHAILNPWTAPAVAISDESRMKALAARVLEQTGGAK
jgi:SNF2 family DNA or RNA helicase